MKGGYHPLSRLEQELGELPVHAGALVGAYRPRDDAEDTHIRGDYARERSQVRRLMARLRASNPGVAGVIAQLESDWLREIDASERAWLRLDEAADQEVDRAASDLVELGRQSAALLQAARAASRREIAIA